MTLAVMVVISVFLTTIVANMGGYAVALTFGLLAAVGTTLITMLLAAMGAWFVGPYHSHSRTASSYLVAPTAPSRTLT